MDEWMELMSSNYLSAIAYRYHFPIYSAKTSYKLFAFQSWILLAAKQGYNHNDLLKQ